MENADNKKLIRKIVEDLTGQRTPFDREIPDLAVDLLTKKELGGLGYSQFNELLLNLGYDRVSHSFFHFLVTQKSTEYEIGSSILNIEQFRSGVDNFQKVAALFFGNIKFAFKNLSSNTDFLNDHLRRFTERREESFYGRHSQIMKPNVIAGEDAYLLGYLIRDELAAKLKHNPDNPELLALEKKRLDTIEKARQNHDSYLVSDHLDVYIATSMREKHEFISVYRQSRAIFEHESIRNLKLRWFDPTQAFCDDRIDKGLAEGLMLRRAKCTIYFAQESDTFGKDSELASTLAQGKPVIAFVPRPTATAAKDLVAELSANGLKAADAILSQLQIYDPAAAWRDSLIRSWLADPALMPTAKGLDRLQSAIVDRFERRNRMLRESHPLGIQLNLETGVANGVLVANTIEQCASLVRGLLLRQLEFDLDVRGEENKKYILLRERFTGSIFRVVTGDAFLTNAFWNFYLNPVEETHAVIGGRISDSKSRQSPYYLTRTSGEQGLLFDYSKPEKGPVKV